MSKTIKMKKIILIFVAFCFMAFSTGSFYLLLNKSLTTSGIEALSTKNQGTLYVSTDQDQLWYITSEGVARQLSFERDTLQPPQITGNTNDYSPTGLSGTNLLVLDFNGSYNLTGIDASSFGEGSKLMIYNKSASNQTITHAATSSAANQFYSSTLGDESLRAGMVMNLVYIQGKWRIQ